MKISKALTYAAGNLREIKNIQKGAEILIYRHTDLNLSILDKDIKKKGNEIIRNRFLRYDGDLNDASAVV